MAVLAAALPHQMDAAALGLRLESIARWISGVQDVEAGLRDVLLGHAASAEPRVARAAQLALARCGDERILAGPFEPCALALAVAPGDALAHVRKALPVADDRSAIALVSALIPGPPGNCSPSSPISSAPGRPPAGRRTSRIRTKSSAPLPYACSVRTSLSRQAPGTRTGRPRCGDGPFGGCGYLRIRLRRTYWRMPPLR
ncbi:hypothetical protein [Actinomadura sp. 3N407]|uniref:hypothetical protein n=1 Tax=Actinomadura sp. 3N407 TaxID=3457423 RepID=UPI003FCC8F13